jgi:hypothetical protein
MSPRAEAIPVHRKLCLGCAIVRVTASIPTIINIIPSIYYEYEALSEMNMKHS